jgi:hypothetical protein
MPGIQCIFERFVFRPMSLISGIGWIEMRCGVNRPLVSSIVDFLIASFHPSESPLFRGRAIELSRDDNPRVIHISICQTRVTAVVAVAVVRNIKTIVTERWTVARFTTNRI